MKLSASYTTIGLLYTALALTCDSNKAWAFTAPQTGKVSMASYVKHEASSSSCLFLSPEIEEPIITEADLKTGDVAIFSAMPDQLSQAIAKITGSDCSHSAIVYRNTSEIIEETSRTNQSGVFINPVAERFFNRTVWIRRPTTDRSNKYQRSMEPIMSAAESFKGHSPYAHGNLYMTAVLAIFRHFALPEGKLYWVMLGSIEYLTAQLVNFYNDEKYAGQTPMVCSQFVYESFKKAGDDYELQIPDLQPKNGTVLNQIIAKVKANPEAYNTKSNERIRTFLRNVWNKLRNKNPPSEDELTKTILSSNEGKDFFLTSRPFVKSGVTTKQFDRVVIRFAKALYAARFGKKMKDVAALDALSYINENEDIFVTPEDLRSNTVNLEPVGKIVLRMVMTSSEGSNS